MNILSIGNSFSQDAQRYLHQVAKADNFEINAFNLYIGGCPLSLHYRNMISKRPEYDLEMNGQSTGFKVSVNEALLNRDWDIVTIQQVSHESTNFDTFVPYIDELTAYIRKCVPKAKILVHRTWGYETGSERIARVNFKTCEEMNLAAKAAYKKAAERIGADGIIPAGDCMMNLEKMGLAPHRDTFHADLGYGRYAIALTWYGYLTGNDVMENKFKDFDVSVTENEIKAAKEAADKALKENI